MKHQNISVTGSLNLNGVGVATTSTLNAFTASSDTKVNALIANTGSYATTGSNTFTGSQIIQGTLTAQTLVVQTVTSSVLYTTGSNIIGSSLSNVQQITGSVGITGSLAINGTGAVVGSGTANYVPKFTASGTIVNSTITDDGITITSTSSIYVNKANPFVRFKGTTLDAYIINSNDKLYIADFNTATKNIVLDLSTGAATFSSGIGISGATATTGGIQFPATQVAIADGNNLDDYEEGTFNPTLGTGGGTSGFVYSTRSGSYTKIGNLVNIRVIISLSTLGGDNGNAYIYDLPFTNGQSTSVIGASIIAGTTSTLSNASILISASANYAQLEKNALSAPITKADLTNTTTILFNATYRV